MILGCVILNGPILFFKELFSKSKKLYIYSNTSSNIVWKTTILVTYIYTVVRRQRRYTRRSGKKLQILNWLRNKYINNVSYSHVLVAQGIARWTSNPEVAGSNPAEDAQYFYHSFFINVHMTSMKAKSHYCYHREIITLWESVWTNKLLFFQVVPIRLVYT